MALSTGMKIAIGLTVVGAGVGIAAVALAKEDEKAPERPKISPEFAAACKEAGGIPMWSEDAGEWACKTKDGKLTPQSKWPAEEEKEEEAEPIYAFCEERGGTIVAQEGHPPLCTFPDGRIVDAWEFLRGEAKPGFPEPPEGPGGEEPVPGEQLTRPEEVKATDVVLVPGASVQVDPTEWDTDRLWVLLPYEAWGEFDASDVPWPGGPKTGQPGEATVVEQAGMGEPGQEGAALFVRWQVTRPGQMWLMHRELTSGDVAKVSVFVPPQKHTAVEPSTFEEGD